MNNALTIGAYALAAVIVAWALHQFAGASAPMAAVAGGFAFLIAGQIHAAAARAQTRARIEKEIRALKRAHLATERELGETRKKMGEMTDALEQKSHAQGRKIVSELKMLESLIREFAAGIARKSQGELPDGIDLPDRRASADAMNYAGALANPDLLEIIRRSLEENRIDLYLQPAVSLPQRKVRFYEALSRLRSEDGNIIMPAQYIKVAEPAGLMSVVDNLLLFRCVQIVRRLTQKRRDVGVFCNISSHTLGDAEFFPQFLEFMHHHRDLGGQIVFEFTQGCVLEAGPQEDANLRYLSGLGFQLSMDQVTTLALDFARLRSLGFRFLKVRADTLISGMKDARAIVAAEDFKDLLARNGMSLIVERIEDEKTVVQLLDYNVDFGQGYLFGEPRAIRDMPEHGREAVEAASSVPGDNVTLLATRLARRAVA